MGVYIYHELTRPNLFANCTPQNTNIYTYIIYIQTTFSLFVAVFPSQTITSDLFTYEALEQNKNRVQVWLPLSFFFFCLCGIFQAFLRHKLKYFRVHANRSRRRQSGEKGRDRLYSAILAADFHQSQRVSRSQRSS